MAAQVYFTSLAVRYKMSNTDVYIQKRKENRLLQVIVCSCYYYCNYHITRSHHGIRMLLKEWML